MSAFLESGRSNGSKTADLKGSFRPKAAGPTSRFGIAFF